MEIQDYDVNSYFVPLNNQLNYSTSFVINNTQLVVNFGYNSRLNQRYFNVVTSGGILLLQNTFIQLRNIIKFNVNFDFLGNGTTKIYFHKKDETQPLDIINWADNIEMYIRTVPPESKAQEDYNNIATWVSDTESTLNSIDEYYDQTQANADSDSKDQVNIKNFDFAIIRYKWNTASGRDLDTRTSITQPPRNVVVGWGRNVTDSPYLTWGSDNTQDGVESVLLDLNQLISNTTSTNTIQIDLRGQWYGNRGTGDVTVEFETYVGGEMQKGGFDYTNTGGKVQQQVSITSNVSTISTSQTSDGDLVGVLEFDIANKKGKLLSKV